MATQRIIVITALLTTLSWVGSYGQAPGPTSASPTPQSTTADPDTVPATWLWVAVGVGGGLVLILAIAVVYYGYKSYVLERKVQDIEDGQYEMQNVVQQVQQEFVEDDEVNYVEDIVTTSPPIAQMQMGALRDNNVQTQVRQQRTEVVQNGYLPPQQNEYVQQPIQQPIRQQTVVQESRVVTTRRDPAEVERDNADFSRFASPEPRMAQRPERQSRDLSPRYDQEMAPYRDAQSRRRFEFETASSRLPRVHQSQPLSPRRAGSIPDLDRIDERAPVLDRSRPFSYINQQPLSKPVSGAGRERGRSGYGRSNSIEEEGAQPRRRQRSPARSDRNFSRGEELRQSRSWDALERAQKRNTSKLDQYGRPLY